MMAYNDEKRLKGIVTKGGCSKVFKSITWSPSLTDRTLHQLHAAEFASPDVAFHNCLANETHNPLFSILVNSFNSVMLEVRLRLFNNLSRMPDRAMLYHARILDRVKANDVKGARVAMEEHLLDTRDLLRQAGKEEAIALQYVS
jgi:DNA-binding FadR family transcriptional regulator